MKRSLGVTLDACCRHLCLFLPAVWEFSPFSQVGCDLCIGSGQACNQLRNTLGIGVPSKLHIAIDNQPPCTYQCLVGADENSALILYRSVAFHCVNISQNVRNHG